MILQSYLPSTRWFAVRNVSGEDIPPYAAMRIGKLRPNEGNTPGYPQELVDNELVMLVSKPDEESEELQELGIHCFNGPFTIGKGDHGQATCDFPVKVLHHVNDVPFVGDLNGFVADQWYVSNQYGGDALRSWDHAAGTHPHVHLEDAIWAMPAFVRAGPRGRFILSGSGHGTTGEACRIQAYNYLGLGFNSHVAATYQVNILRSGLYRVGLYGVGSIDEDNRTGRLAMRVNGQASAPIIENTWQKAAAASANDPGDEITISGITNRLSIWELIDLEKGDVVSWRVSSSNADATAAVSNTIFCLEWVERRFARYEILRQNASHSRH